MTACSWSSCLTDCERRLWGISGGRRSTSAGAFGQQAFVFVKNFFHDGAFSDSPSSRFSPQTALSYRRRPGRSTCSCWIPDSISNFLYISAKAFLLFICQIEVMPGATGVGDKKHKNRISLPVLLCWQDTKQMSNISFGTLRTLNI